MKKNAVTIDGEEYVRASDIPSAPAASYEGMDYVIVRTYSAGVFAGYLSAREGKEAALVKARRLWYWDGAASLSQLAVDGVSKPTTCKFPCEVSQVILTEVIEVLPATEKARMSIASVKVWEE